MDMFQADHENLCAVLIVTNTFNIVGIFDAAQSVVNSASGVIFTSAKIDIFSTISGLSTKLKVMDLGRSSSYDFRVRLSAAR